MLPSDLGKSNVLVSAANVIERLPEWLEDERRRRGLSRREMARESGLGYHVINGLAVDGKMPSARNLAAILRWLAQSVEDQ